MGNSDMSSAGERPFRRRERPVKRSGTTWVHFEPYSDIHVRESAAFAESMLSPHAHEEWFQRGVMLAWELYEARRVKDYSDEQSSSLVTLFVESLNSFLAAVLLCRCGYYSEAFPLLRGAVESAELMEYFLANKIEVVKWINKHRDFDNLGWVRSRLPQTNLRRSFYDFINNFVHPNAIEVQYFSSSGDMAGDRTLFVGPFKLDENKTNPISIAAALVSYPIRVLWQHDPSLVSEDWVRRFEEFDGATGYAFSDRWKSRWLNQFERESKSSKVAQCGDCSPEEGITHRMRRDNP